MSADWNRQSMVKMAKHLNRYKNQRTGSIQHPWLCLFTASALFVAGSSFSANANEAAIAVQKRKRLDSYRLILDHRQLTDSEATDFQKLVTSMGNDSDALTLVGIFCHRAGYADLAAGSYEKALQIDPRNEQALMALATICLNNRDKKEIRAQLNLLVQQALQQQMPAENMMRLAILLDSNNESNLADRIYRDLASRPFTNDPAAGSARAWALIVTHNFSEAEKQADACLASPATRLVALKAKSEALVAQGLLDDAMPYLQELAEKAPYDVAASTLAATVCTRLHHPDQAISYLVSQLAYTGFDERSKHTKATLVSLIPEVPTNDLQSIIAKVCASFMDAKLAGTIQLAIGDVFDKLKCYDLAIKHYQEGIKLMPDYARAYMRVAKDVDRLSGNPNKSHAYYTRAFNINSNDAEVRASYNRSDLRVRNFSNDIAGRLKASFKPAFDLTP